MSYRSWIELGGAVALALCAGCGRAPPPVPPGPHTTVFTLSCASPIGPVNSQVAYTVTASAEPVKAGGDVTYTIVPPSTSAAPLTPTFISSTSVYDVPAGLAIDGLQMQAASTADYSSITATLDGGTIDLTLLGSFPMNATVRAVPPMIVTSRVTAASGATITWMPPVAVVGQAGEVFFGAVTSNCTIENPVPLATSHVE